MKDTACQDTLNLSLRWLTGSYIFWSVPLIYILLSISPLMFGYPAAGPSLALFIKVYCLFALILLVKYLTLTNFPDSCRTSDEIRKLFTSPKPFHALLAINMIVFPMLYREFGLSFAYIRNFDSWSYFQAIGLGFMEAIAFIAAHEHIVYWYDPPYGRIHWLALQIPSSFMKSLFFCATNLILMSILWTVTHLRLAYEMSFYFIYQDFAIGAIVFNINYILTTMLKNFLAKPTLLDDENSIGEQLAISGLTINDENIHFQCFQDLLRVSKNNYERRISIFDPKTSQWKILLDKGIDYISAVSTHIRSYAVKKSKIRPNEMVSGMPDWQQLIFKFFYFMYYVFNEPFDVQFRNELFRITTMAALSSNVLTNFVTCSGMQSFILKDNSLSLILQAQVDALQDLENYKHNDPEIDTGLFESNIKRNIKEIKQEYKECFNSLSLRSDILGFIQRVSN
ncbi:unnamed protein product [Blepharisma stoltei]|uniref:Gustatory receptor n=1 Tax=Blepharisma stoltei TaxID=1481888 RepID=A0AAU9II66_9CILI|nr:unnamed protein product [Blepharisma stoltei]